MRLTVLQLKEILNQYPDDTEVSFEIDENEGGALDYKGVNDSFVKTEEDREGWENFPSSVTIQLHNLTV